MVKDRVRKLTYVKINGEKGGSGMGEKAEREDLLGSMVALFCE